MKQKMMVTGKVYWELVRDGKVVDAGMTGNLVLTDGFEIICDLLGGLGGQTNLQCIAIGDDDTSPSVSQTDLQGAELDFESSTNTRPESNLARFVVDFDPGEGTGTIEETVIADTVAAKGGRKCAARAIIGPIVKGAGDLVTIIWEFTFEQA